MRFSVKIDSDENNIRTGGCSQKNWVGVCGPLPKTLTLFMTKICDIPYPKNSFSLAIVA